MPRMSIWGRWLSKVGVNFSHATREQHKTDLLLMLGQCRGPGRGVEIPKHPAHLMKQGKTREQAEAEIVSWFPMLLAAQELNNTRRDLVLIRYRFTEVLCFRVDLETSVSNIAFQDMERTGQVRKQGTIVIPGERGAEADPYSHGPNNFE